MRTLKESNNVKMYTVYTETDKGPIFDYAYMRTEERTCTISINRFSGKCMIELAKAKIDVWGIKEYKDTRTYFDLEENEAWVLWDKKISEYGYDYRNAEVIF